ncbi:hypothetical protein Tco_1465754 [Tanacetum coccineum]
MGVDMVEDGGLGLEGEGEEWNGKDCGNGFGIEFIRCVLVNIGLAAYDFEVFKWWRVIVEKSIWAFVVEKR